MEDDDLDLEKQLESKLSRGPVHKTREELEEEKEKEEYEKWHLTEDKVNNKNKHKQTIT